MRETIGLRDAEQNLLFPPEESWGTSTHLIGEAGRRCATLTKIHSVQPPHEGGDHATKAKMQNYRPNFGAVFSICSAMRASGLALREESRFAASL